MIARLLPFTNSPTVAPAAPIGERPKRSFQCKREFLPHAFALPTGGQVGSRHSPFKRGIVGSSPTRSTNTNNFFATNAERTTSFATDVFSTLVVAHIFCSECMWNYMA